MDKQALVALGSNIGDRVALLRQAVDAIRSRPGVRNLRASRLYETPAVTLNGVGELGGDDAFLNAAVMFKTDMPPRDLLAELLEIETQLGRLPRNRRETWGPRPIDLDLLLLGDHKIDEPRLTLPHPRIRQRWFVLAPLADLIPSTVLPGPADASKRPQTVRHWLDVLQAQPDAAAGVGRIYRGASWHSESA